MSVWEQDIEAVSHIDELAPRTEQDQEHADAALRSRTRRALSLRHRLVALDLAMLTLVWAPVLLLPSDRTVFDLFAVGITVLAGFLSVRAQGLYTTWVNSMRVVVLARLMWTAIISCFACWVVYLWLTSIEATAWQAVVGTIGTLVALAIGRSLFDRWLSDHRTGDRYCRSVLIVGTAEDVGQFSIFLGDHPELGYRIAGWVGPEGDTCEQVRLGDVDDSLQRVNDTGASGALILAAGLNRNDVNDVTRELVDAGVHVHVWSGLAGINYRRLVTVPVGREPFVHVAPVTISRTQLVGKRAIDIALASVTLLLASPILVVSAILIKRHDGGPVFFRQIRVGQGGEEITVHKLRTMVVDAEAQLEEVQAANERKGPLFKLKRDPRVTPIGGFLRRTSIDELPQLFDVLRGDLSLVGPRPALPAEVAQFDEQLLGRLKVRPGITGLWQVEGRDKPSFDVYRRLDLFYVENWSLALDFAILLDSVPAVLSRGRRSSTQGPTG